MDNSFITSNITKISDHFQFIPFVSSSDDRTSVCEKLQTPEGNLNGDEASQFYQQIISLPSNSKPPSFDNSRNTSKSVKKKPASSSSESSRHSIFYHAQNGNLQGIDYFLSNQCHVDVQDMYGWTPLMCATFEGHYDTVEHLIKKGADLTVKNKQGITAFDIALSKNNSSLIDFFKNGTASNLNVKSEVNKEPKYCQLCKCSYTESTVSHKSSIAHLVSTKSDDVSTYYHIPENNKGFQIMLKKGWDKNKGLGLDAKGRKFPIKTVLKTDRTCIGGKKEKPKVTHFGANDHRSIRRNIQPTLNLKREKKLNKREIKRISERNRKLEVEFRRQFHLE